MIAAERRLHLDRARPWVLACAAFLHLDHWTVTLADEVPGGGAQAQIERWRGQLDCRVSLSDTFFALPECEQREVCWRTNCCTPICARCGRCG